MPHVRGCLKTSSQLENNCVWSDPFCTVNPKKLPKLQYESATPQRFYSRVFLESGSLGGDEHLDHSNHSDLLSSEKRRRAQTASRVDPRLGEALAMTSVKIASKFSAKTPQKLREHVWRSGPYFYALKTAKFSHEIPLSFPQGFPHGFPRRFRAWETKRSP